MVFLFEVTDPHYNFAHQQKESQTHLVSHIIHIRVILSNIGSVSFIFMRRCQLRLRFQASATRTLRRRTAAFSRRRRSSSADNNCQVPLQHNCFC